MEVGKKTFKHAIRVIIRICIALILAYLLHPYVMDIMAEYEEVLALGFLLSFIPQLILIVFLFIVLKILSLVLFSNKDATWNHIIKLGMQLPYLIVLTLFTLFLYETFGVWGAVLGVIIIELKEIAFNAMDHFTAIKE